MVDTEAEPPNADVSVAWFPHGKYTVTYFLSLAVFAFCLLASPPPPIFFSFWGSPGVGVGGGDVVLVGRYRN